MSDVGSHSCKVGLSGDDRPTCRISSCIGKPTHQVRPTRSVLINKGLLSGMQKRDTYVGAQAQARKELLSLHYPIERGVITDWEALKTLFHYMYDVGVFRLVAFLPHRVVA